MRVAFHRYSQIVTARFIRDKDRSGPWAYQDIEALNSQGLREFLFEYGRQVTPTELRELLCAYSTLDPPVNLAWEDTCQLLGLPRSTTLEQPEAYIEDIVEEVVVNVDCPAAVGLRVMLSKTALATLKGIDKDCAVGPGHIVAVHTSKDKPKSKVACSLVQVDTHVLCLPSFPLLYAQHCGVLSYVKITPILEFRSETCYQ